MNLDMLALFSRPTPATISTTKSHKQPTSKLLNHSIMSILKLSATIIIFSLCNYSALARTLSDSTSNEHTQHNQQQFNRQHHSNKLLANPNTPLQSSSSMNQNRCQSGWMWFNNKCWVTTQSRRDFAHAIDLCRKMYNSTLPTIHSEDENEFLRNNIDLHNSPIWLFARHNHQYNKTRWLDKTPVNYTRWDVGQPNDKSSLVCIKTEDNWYMKKAEPVDGQTECISFWEDARWGTNVGCQVLLPVVCEKKLTPINRMQAMTNGNMGSGGAGDEPNGFMGHSDTQFMSSVSGSTGSVVNTINIYTCLMALLLSTLLMQFHSSTTEKRQLH